MKKAYYNPLNHAVFVGSKKVLNILSLCIILLIIASCEETSTPLFELKKDTGIDFSNQLSPTTDLNILTYLYYYNGGGVAAGDFNNDGLVDLYFTGNQVADKLYLNLGDLKFIDITVASGISNEENWTTGVSTVDINNDGLLDIYVSKIGQFQNIRGHNLLYVNQGINASGHPSFKEESKKYGLAIQSYATQTAFFDYDLDGDLDMFLLNHSVYPNRTYGKGNSRNKVDSLAGDKLFQNQEGKFVEVSEEAGIFQGRIGYGLGIGISDLNNDGYPDIYIGNDFFENDYLYINQKDGTFKEMISADENFVGHTSHFSMGNDIADLNNDGWHDIVSLDMLPQDLSAYKTSGREYNNQIYDQYLKNGYRPQYMQNMLLRNNQGAFFQETAFASGISATDWSWAPLIVDLDNDGFKDIFISNGILGATNDMDFINFIANKKIQEQLNDGMEEKDLKFTEQLPQRKLSNYFFKNNHNFGFKDATSEWFKNLPSFSNGSVYADLDNDGDQDLVVNNVQAQAFLIENKSELSDNEFLKLRFKGSPKNTMGIGAKVSVFSDSLSLSYENNTTRGYLSSVAPEMTIGIGQRSMIDSIVVIWSGGNYQTLKNVVAGTTLMLDYSDAKKGYSQQTFIDRPIFTQEKESLDFIHKELRSYEFGREPLIPYSKGSEGPKISVADVNNDGLTDVYIGGGKKQAGALFLQGENSNFKLSPQASFEIVKNNEETDNLFFDADNDGDQDLLIVSGGNEFIQGKELRPTLFLNEDGQFTISDSFPIIETNASVIKAADLDQDGDLDLIIGSNALPRQFGRHAENFVLYNDGAANFKDLSDTKAISFKEIGLIEHLEVVDLNNDDLPDLIAVGHWMPVQIFINSTEGLILQNNKSLSNTFGLWNHVKAADFDNDGDIDFIAGNWGLNSRLQASIDEPMQLYIADFDQNDKEEAILTYYQEGQETVFSSKDDLSKQLPYINKNYLSYADFAQAEFEQIFDKSLAQNAQRKRVYELSTCYFENKGSGEFHKYPLPYLSQLSSVKTIYLQDFNQDGFQDILLAGNDHDISTQLGRLDASHGLVLLNDQKGSFEPNTALSPNISGKARDFAEIEINGEKYLIVALNNAAPMFLKMNRIND